jgi:hypothetical protein
LALQSINPVPLFQTCQRAQLLTASKRLRSSFLPLMKAQYDARSLIAFLPLPLNCPLHLLYEKPFVLTTYGFAIHQPNAAVPDLSGCAVPDCFKKVAKFLSAADESTV